ncbi:hypothetical protein SAMN05660297_02934 [Natronincola peptidivorans]|uniref:Uncharacterized protein n=1 Tax=Natronincola peptidivorans TaxID=426128 RepID=A0A1I0FV10_9FIRM|nr:hypothetical protein [Natronincola peptidivorans]SET61500.1 hypothetical protein SAMN05660297_02934 [Natronincola peptidivorans]
MNTEGIVLGSTFMLLVGSIIFVVITDLPRRLRLLAKGSLILGASMLIFSTIGSYYFPQLYIDTIGRVLYYVLIHLGIMTILYGKIYIRFEDIKYKDSKWKPTNNQPLYIYIITFLIIQMLGYGLNIDVLKVVVLTENAARSTFPGVPLLMSLIAGGTVYYNGLRQKNSN